MGIILKDRTRCIHFQHFSLLFTTFHNFSHFSGPLFTFLFMFLTFHEKSHHYICTSGASRCQLRAPPSDSRWSLAPLAPFRSLRSLTSFNFHITHSLRSLVSYQLLSLLYNNHWFHEISKFYFNVETHVSSFNVDL